MKAGKAGKTGKTGKAGKQRGGAAWYSIPAERLGDWTSHLHALGLDLTEHSTRSQQSVEAASLEEYYTIVERQDELFEAALQIIASKVSLTPNYTSTDVIASAATIDARKDELFGYIDDVEQLVNFQKTVVQSAQSWRDYTKLEDLRNKADETLSDILIYSNRVTNVFIKSLANILIVLHQDPTILTQSSNDHLKRLSAQQYESNLKANTLLLTLRPLRDGFYLGQTKGELNDEINGNIWFEDEKQSRFFESLIDELLLIKDKPDTEIFKINGALVDLRTTQASWAMIAAHVFLAYKHGKHTNILQFFTTKNTADTTTAPDRTYTPDAAYDSVSVRGVMYENLRTWMEDKMLQFILHLSYTIKQNEAAVIAAMGASSPSSPSSSNSASSAPPPSTTTTTTAPPPPTTTTTAAAPPPTTAAPPTTTTTAAAPPSSSSSSASSSASTNTDNAKKQTLIEGLATLGASKSKPAEAEESKRIIRDALKELSLKDVTDIDAEKNNPLIAAMITPKLISQLISLRKTSY
jgi:hypothetical protein